MMDPLPELDVFDHDISFVTDCFTTDGDHHVQVIDSEQRPVVVKTEQPWESKATEAAVRELQMGHEFGRNQRLRQPTLQDAVINPESLLLIPEQQNTDVFNPMSCISDVDVLENIELHQVIHSLTNENFVEIQAIPSDKKRNPPYEVQEKDITSLNKTPVTIIVSRAREGQSVHVSLRYVDEIAKKKAVNPCKNHQDWEERPVNLPSDFNFCLMTECSYERIDNHPTAVINIQESFIDTNGMFRFSIVFLCLSSCHKIHGKKMEAVITVHDSHSNLVLGEEHFTLRICKNVKRDHKEKRKLSGQEEYQGEEPRKVQRVENIITPCEDTNGNNQGEPKSYMFQMASKSNEDLVIGLIAALGGKCCPIQTIENTTLPVQ